MHPNPKSPVTQLRSSVFLFIIVGNLLFSAIFVMSMGVQVVKSTNNMQQQTVETNDAPEQEQKVVTLAQIN